MTRVTANGYFDSIDAEQRYEMKKQLNAQRTTDYKNGSYELTGGLPTPEVLPEDAPLFLKDYVDFYKTERGYHRNSPNSNGGWNVTHALSFTNMPILQYSNEIRNAVLMIHGEKAHSVYFSKDAFENLTGENKELIIIPSASHTDLYDNKDIIPFGKIEEFFKSNLV